MPADPSRKEASGGRARSKITVSVTHEGASAHTVPWLLVERGRPQEGKGRTEVCLERQEGSLAFKLGEETR